MKRLTALILTLFTLVAAAAGAQHGVSLKSSARVDGEVLVGDIADISGPEAGAIAGVVVVEDVSAVLAGGAWHGIGIDEVRAAIDAAEGRDAWGLVSYRGASCSVGQRVSKAPKPIAAPNTEKPDELPPGARLRDWVVAKLARTLGVSVDDIRVSFREGDAPVLARPVLGRPVTIVPLGMSRTMPVKIRMYEPSGAVREDTVRGEVEVRRRVLRVSQVVPRHERLTFDALVEETAWVDADAVSPSLDEALGSVALRSLSVGEIVRTRDIERPVLIRRGELARVHCLSGSLIIECEARAMDDGRLGDTIEFRPTLGETRRGKGGRFRAVVRGAGLAVMRAGRRTTRDASGDATLRETDPEPSETIIEEQDS